MSNQTMMQTSSQTTISKHRSLLFVSHRLQRIQTRGAAGGPETGHETNYGGKHHDGGSKPQRRIKDIRSFAAEPAGKQIQKQIKSFPPPKAHQKPPHPPPKT